MKYNFVSGAVGVNSPFKNVDKPGRHIKVSMLEATMQTFIEGVLR